MLKINKLEKITIGDKVIVEYIGLDGEVVLKDKINWPKLGEVPTKPIKELRVSLYRKNVH